MARFYFDISDGSGRSVDTEGQELPSAEAARYLAAQELTHLIRDTMPDGERESYVVTVRDGNRVPIYLVTAMMVGESLL